MISNRTVQNITYSFDFYPSKMLIKGKLNPSVWTGRRLIGITGSTYQYNSDGIRTKKMTPNETTTFELEGSNIISMYKVTSAENVRLDFVYDASSTLIGVNTSEGNYFYSRDITGNITGIVDRDGKFIVKYKYDAWGKVLERKILKESIISRHNPFVYKGYFLDEETGFYYLKSRYYDPSIRRFISIDSPQYIDPVDLSGLNLYAYCGNNPVMGYDPSGNSWTSFWKSTFGKVLGTVLVVAAVVVLSVATAGVGAAVTTALGSGFMAAVAGGAVGGAISGAIFGAGISMVSQGISNGYGNIDYAKVGMSALSGAISGAIAGAAFAGIGRGIGLLGKTKLAQRPLKNWSHDSKNFMFGSKTGNFTFFRNGHKFRIEASIQHGIHYHSLASGSTAPLWKGIFAAQNIIAGIVPTSIYNY